MSKDPLDYVAPSSEELRRRAADPKAHRRAARAAAKAASPTSNRKVGRDAIANALAHARGGLPQRAGSAQRLGETPERAPKRTRISRATVPLESDPDAVGPEVERAPRVTRRLPPETVNVNAPAPAPTQPPTYTPPIPGGGIASRRPAPTSTGTIWTPEPASVLVLGGGLIVLGILSNQGAIGPIANLFWKQGAVPAPGFSLKRILVEIGFVVILFLLASLSDTLARGVVVFEAGLYAILLIMHPQILLNLKNMVDTLTK